MNEITKIINSNKYRDLVNDIYFKYKNVCPKKEDVFRAFELCPLEKIKVVIFGQDPYYQKDVADGLAFSTQSTKCPASLKNIFIEIKDEYPETVFRSNDLSSWAKQGILLLNTCLTVEENNPLSMVGIWKDLILDVISILNKEDKKIIFVLWGNHAKKLKQFIDSKHFILESSHPSPFSANYGFFKNGHFKKINQLLKSLDEQEINWNTY